MDKKTSSYLLLALPIFLALGISWYFQTQILTNPQQFQTWLQSFGSHVILVYILLQSLTIIIAPIGGLFLQVAILSIFDPIKAFTLIYFVTTPLYLLNFYLARKYGRPLVQKVIGHHALETVDNFAKDSGILTLLIFKMFQNGNFDYISYAAGLTNIKFKHFALINFLVGIPSVMLAYFIFSRFNNLTAGIFALIITAYILAAISISLNLYLKKRKLRS